MGYDENNRKYDKPSQTKKNNNPKTPIIEAFEKYSKELEFKQDKYERIIKLSRDVAIASKRIIFSLHALLRSSNYEQDLAKITENLKTVRNTHLKNIAFELKDDDPYQYCRAYTAGLQEYIEAVTFFHFITKGDLFDLKLLEKELTFHENFMNQVDQSKESISLFIPLFDYILGIQDLTGELMRHCINSFSARNLNAGNADCNFVKNLYTGMLLLNLSGTSLSQNMQGRDFSRKLVVALQSLNKMELVRYASHIRGSEALDYGFTSENALGFETYAG